MAALVLGILSGRSAAASSAYAEELISAARDRNLAGERLWRLLLHYKPKLIEGVRSEADGPEFFLAPGGRNDPEAELAATIRAFFDPKPSDPEAQHPQCRFPARYAWLKERLGFDPSRLPERRCPRLEAWRKALDPGSVTLIFASHYMNNPASMFGHTLLRLNRRGPPQPALLDYGVNYAADVTTRNGLAFAVLGVFGGFTGRFANFPYYLKIQEYSNIDSRDIWEYELRLTQERIDRMLLHLWELGTTYFDYFFFQENCSYHILSLLEMADPRLRLTDRFFFHVVPSETVRLIAEQPGLVGGISYRPSLRSQFRQKWLAMNPEERGIVRRAIRAKPTAADDASLAPERRALAIDAVLDYLQYRKMKGGNKLPPDEATFRRDLLVRRSALGIAPAVDGPALSTRPDRGHRPSRLRLAAGSSGGYGVTEISFPSFHDLLDPDDGYPPHAQIELLTPALRYYPGPREIALERLDLIRITSLSPLEPLFYKPSWRVDVGYQTLRDLDCDRCHWFKAEVGTGAAADLGPALAYGFLNLEAGIADRFDPDFRLSPGAMAGLLLRVPSVGRINAGGAFYYPALGGSSGYYRNFIHQHVDLGRNLGLRLEFNHFKTAREALAAIQVHF